MSTTPTPAVPAARRPDRIVPPQYLWPFILVTALFFCGEFPIT